MIKNDQRYSLEVVNRDQDWVLKTMTDGWMDEWTDGRMDEYTVDTDLFNKYFMQNMYRTSLVTS